MMILKKGNNAVQPAAKFSPRRKGPDSSLLFIRFLLLAIIAALVFSLIQFEEPPWRTAVILLVLFLLASLRKAREWERAVILRLGKFHKVKGPGFFFIIPVVDQVYKTIDIRIRVTDFYAQETLTGDSVTVNVDAFCFWLVWDPQKAVLEIENFEEAVALASKAALRNAMSKNDLSTFLARGDLIEKQIQEEVEKQTTEWGITVQYVEITDIQIPEALQDSLSRMAQAEREKKARIFLAEAEIEIAKKLEEAISIYAKNEGALKLKILSILNEGLKAGNSMMLIPNSIAEELKTKDIFGIAALNELKKGSGS
jgi:regulator of protease activity HflC (stomatin/prohibitin superfamily)